MDLSIPSHRGYPYRVLQPGTIRLLRVYQGAVNHLVCNLEVAHISQLPPYEALSYCWGDPSDQIPIDCNGSGGLKITKTLHSALLPLQLPNQARLIWADAICIYFDRYRTEYRRNLRFRPLFSEGFRFASWINKPLFIRLRVVLTILYLDPCILALKCMNVILRWPHSESKTKLFPTMSIP
jgi:hypothetical protein